MDDILAKTQEDVKHVDDLRETFESIRKFDMRLNPENAPSRYKPKNS